MTELLLEGLYASTAAIVCVLALRGPWRRAFGAERVPLLWAIVPAVLLAVCLPARTSDAAGGEALLWFAVRVSSPSGDAAASPALSWREIALGAWLLGSAGFALRFASAQRRFRRRLGTLRPRGDGTFAASGVACGPAVLGVLRPQIVLPADFEQRYSTEQQQLIVLHERSHAARGDVAANAVATVLRVVYWFNPLVHYAAARLRHDHELASDADVLRRRPQARRCYADTLLEVQLAVPGLPVGCLWQSSHPLKERITMLKNPLPGIIRRRAGLAVGLAAAVGCGGLAWAAQPPQAAASPEPVAHEAAAHDAEPTYNAIRPPKYPQSAIDARQGGNVVLKILVGADGAAKEVEVVDGVSAEIDDAAVAAAQTWKFNPAMKAGRAVEAWINVPICFSPDEDRPTCDTPSQESLDGIWIKPKQS